jgi:hypothetical protein
MCLAVAICATGTRYVTLPGYAYKTDPDCQRTVPKDVYDKKCDWPRLGIKGFSQPSPITIGI